MISANYKIWNFDLLDLRDDDNGWLVESNIIITHLSPFLVSVVWDIGYIVVSFLIN